MGWTFYRPSFYKNGKIDRKAELDYKYGNLLIKSQMVGTTWFAAIKQLCSNEIWAAVYLTAIDKGDFGYKDMDETMGPYDYRCPKSILKLLTPTKNMFANGWREKCYEYHKQQAKKTKVPEIMEFVGKTDKNNDTIRLRVDVANRKFYRNFISFYGEPIQITKQAVNKMVAAYKWFGWEEEKI